MFWYLFFKRSKQRLPGVREPFGNIKRKQRIKQHFITNQGTDISPTIWWINHLIMSVSENYIPQSENLEHFNNIVDELRSITDENTQLKNNILTKVDLLIKQLNHGHVDNSDVIRKLNGFIARFGVDEAAKSSNGTGDGMDEKTQLLEQNKKLKEILASKIEYNDDIEQLNKEYQEAIDQVMRDVRIRKFHSDHLRIENFKKIHGSIAQLQDEEFQAYLILINHQEILFKIGRAISDVFKNLNQDNRDELELQKLLTTLELYKSSCLNKNVAAITTQRFKTFAEKFKYNRGKSSMQNSYNGNGYINNGSYKRQHAPSFDKESEWPTLGS